MSLLTRLGTLLLCCLSVPALGQSPTSYWNLDSVTGGTATDSINGNNGTWQNGANNNLNQVGGIIGNAADLNDAGGAGANNFFQIPSLNELNGAGGVTIATWVNTESQGSSGYNGIFMTRNFNNQSNNSWGLAVENNGNERLDSRVDGPGIDSPNGLLAPGNGWAHIALTWDGATQTHRQFVNGVQTNTTSTAGDGGLGATIAGVSNGPWFIGYDNCCGNTRDFDGQIDEAAVWNQALSPTQVQQLYDAGLNNVAVTNAFAASTTLGPVQQGLVGSWNMDQASDTPVASDAINSNHAVLSGANNSTAWVAGQVGRALDFDGGNDQAIISGISQIDGSPEMTISTWVNSDGGNNGWEGIFQHRSPGNGNQVGLMFPGGGAADDLQGRINNSNFGDGTTPAGAAPTGTWAHVVQTYKAGDYHRIYVDGVLVQEDIGANVGNIISDGAWRFGNDTCCGGRFYNGQIDDTGLWNRALGEQEIEAVRQAGLNSISHTRAFIPENGQVQQDLVGHWTFDQARFSPQANDSIANADAALTNMDGGSDWVGGQIGGALQFDGANDQAVISGAMASQLNTALNGSDALTMSMWIRQDGANENNEGIFEHRGPGNANLTGFNTPGSGTDNLQFRINSQAITTDANVLLDDQWQHIVGVWESNERFEIWVDGLLVQDDSAPSGVLAAVGDWRFGNDVCCGNRFFEGAIDDAGLWDRALSPFEIQGLYLDGLQGLNAQQAVATPEPASIALWVALGLAGAVVYVRGRRKS